MDRNSIIGFILIGLILVLWLYFQNKQSTQQQQKQQQEQKTLTDTTKKTLQPDTTQKQVALDTLANVQVFEKYGSLFGKYETGEDKVIMIETDKYYAEFSSKGGAIIKYEVKGFKTWDGYPVQLLYLNKGGQLNLLFTSTEGKLINTKDLYFNTNYKAWEKVTIKGSDEYKFTFEIPVDTNGGKIVKTYTIKNGSYIFGVDVDFYNSSKFISNFEYQLVWENSLKLTEYRSDAEGAHSEAFAEMGDELEVVDVTSKDEPVKSDLNGTTDWVSSRIKYFAVFLIPQNRNADGSYITGNYYELPHQGFEKDYSIALKMLIKNDKLEKYKFNVYLGPVDYEILKSYNIGMEKTMRFSLDFLVRPIAQYAILPFFLFIHKFISNWGLVIIIFSVVMKIVLTPFTRFQMKSMKKMGELQPKMNALREKYKDDPQRQQQMMMKLYKEEKINPAGGCLPLLLQLPILYALFGVFNSTIELRQAYFGLWITDLSVPDVILQLPFKIPLFGIDYISGLALLMGITMFLQQKMTIKDPKQMAMVYVMPIMLTLLFTTLPAGLNLYYFMFNLLSIIEQYFVTKKGKKEAEEKAEAKPQLKHKGKP
ncbi:MAG: membrane protein insertase YidC [Chlorobi bacterium]|nr:membrane protein insertase YidC [Chlorobiota bacterium]MCI0716768.1 membrane protein insertase YidC [Chlorobiota bacterium]